LKAIEEENVYH